MFCDVASNMIPKNVPTINESCNAPTKVSFSPDRPSPVSSSLLDEATKFVVPVYKKLNNLAE